MPAMGSRADIGARQPRAWEAYPTPADWYVAFGSKGGEAGREVRSIHGRAQLKGRIQAREEGLGQRRNLGGRGKVEHRNHGALAVQRGEPGSLGLGRLHEALDDLR